MFETLLPVLGITVFIGGCYYIMAFLAYCFSGGQIAAPPFKKYEPSGGSPFGRDWEKYPEDPYE